MPCNWAPRSRREAAPREAHSLLAAETGRLEIEWRRQGPRWSSRGTRHVAVFSAASVEVLGLSLGHRRTETPHTLSTSREFDISSLHVKPVLFRGPPPTSLRAAGLAPSTDLREPDSPSWVLWPCRLLEFGRMTRVRGSGELD